MDVGIQFAFMPVQRFAKFIMGKGLVKISSFFEYYDHDRGWRLYKKLVRMR